MKLYSGWNRQSFQFYAQNAWFSLPKSIFFSYFPSSSETDRRFGLQVWGPLQLEAPPWRSLISMCLFRLTFFNFNYLNTLPDDWFRRVIFSSFISKKKLNNLFENLFENFGNRSPKSVFIAFSGHFFQKKLEEFSKTAPFSQIFTTKKG